MILKKYYFGIITRFRDSAHKYIVYKQGRRGDKEVWIFLDKLADEWKAGRNFEGFNFNGNH